MKATIKTFTGLGAIIVSLVGVCLLAATVFAYLKSDLFLGDTYNRNLILGILFGASIAVIGTGINGLCGICKQKPKMMCAFQILIIFFLLVFLGIAIGIYYVPDTVFNGDCQTNTNPMVSVANQTYTSAQSFCKDPACLCAMDTSAQTLANKGYSSE